MLNALKNVKSKAKEIISTASHGGKVGRIHDISKESSPSPIAFGYIENGVFHDYREALDFGEDRAQVKQQWFPSVSNGKDFPKMYKSSYEIYDEEAWKTRKKNIDLLRDIHDEGTLKMYREYLLGISADSNDVNHSSTIISGGLSEEIIKELYSGKMKDHEIKFAALEENLDENYIPFPVARLAVAGKDSVSLRSFLEASKCKEYGINAVTICKPDENKTRGVRLTLLKGENGQEVRSYEVINGTYKMDLCWYVEGKKCIMKIEVSDDGSAKILKRNGVTDEQIYAHTEIMVGKQHEPNFLYEALGLDLQQGQAKPRSIEGITPMLNNRSKLEAVQETTASSSKDSKEGAKVEQLLKKNPEVKSALKELESELQKESSEVAKPSTDMAKPDIKKVGEKKEEKNISSPAR